jgi:hypothetical protein
MSGKDRDPWEDATTITQEILDASHDNLSIRLEMVAEIETPTTTLYLSDRDKYVGGKFYRSRVTFPLITRTLGELISPEIEFSTLTLEINNADGEYNNFLPAGADFDGWIGKQVLIKVGIADIASTYRTIFKGFVTDVGGFQRSLASIRIIARDSFSSVTQEFPNVAFSPSLSGIYPVAFPHIEDTYIGKMIPVIYGNWNTPTYLFQGLPEIPATPINGKVAEGNLSQRVYCVVSININQFFNASEVYLVRSGEFWKMSSLDIVNVSPNQNFFEVKQSGVGGGVTIVDGAPYEFAKGDIFYVRVIGKSTGASEAVAAQARDILITYGGISSGDFATSWANFETISESKSRIWIQEPVSAISYALSLLEQVRLEGYVSNDLKFSINSLRFANWNDAPSYTVRNWDIERGSLNLAIDERTNLNKLQGVYSFSPVTGENRYLTKVYKNQAAITQAKKSTYQKLAFPNLYIDAEVTTEVIEQLKLLSAYSERITCNLTWRALLFELGNIVKVFGDIGATQFNNTPVMLRSIGYNPQGLKLECNFLSLQMMPYKTYNPGYAGITGGQSAFIEEDI